MDIESIIEQLENTIGLIEQDGQDWWDERDIPMLKQIIDVLSDYETKVG